MDWQLTFVSRLMQRLSLVKKRGGALDRNHGRDGMAPDPRDAEILVSRICQHPWRGRIHLTHLVWGRKQVYGVEMIFHMHELTGGASNPDDLQN